jgi:hypothetical protein
MQRSYQTPNRAAVYQALAKWKPLTDAVPAPKKPDNI